VWGEENDAGSSDGQGNAGELEHAPLVPAVECGHRPAATNVKYTNETASVVGVGFSRTGSNRNIEE
jgi:hypothetical protein